ncbi:MAG TPA: hypothetical protein VGM77_05305 [Gemmatimonadales bacterium]|jgi:hypothetical protein
MSGSYQDAPRHDAGLWREGVITGVLGAVVVALFYLCIDAGRGHPLLTPSTLGQALLLHVPVTQTVDSGAVIAYTIFHFVAFIAFAMVLTALTRAAETSNLARYAEFQLLVVFAIFFYGVVSVGSEVVRGMLPFEGVLAANVLAGAVMIMWLWRHHPRLRSAAAHTELGATNKRSDVTSGVR